MVLEVAILDVKPGLSDDFEAAFTQAQMIISSMKGYVSHQLQRCLEKSGRYIRLVTWETLEDHTLGFRGSPEYQEGAACSTTFTTHSLMWSTIRWSGQIMVCDFRLAHPFLPTPPLHA